MSLHYRGWLLVGLLLATAAYAIAEEISLTTYYPSPRGVYQVLKVGGGYTLTPPATLQVVKSANDGTLAFRVDDEAGPFEDDTPFVIDEQGKVGIGTTNPSSFKLQVAGAVGPDANATYDLGSSLLRFRDSYLSGGVTAGGSVSVGGGVTASGNVSAADPTAANHLVTKNYAELNYKDPPGQWTCTLRSGGYAVTSSVACVAPEKVIAGGCIYTGLWPVSSSPTASGWYCSVAPNSGVEQVAAQVYCCK